MSDNQYYYCLQHKTVEPYAGCKASERLGPYVTQAEAADALQHAQERNEAWDNDPRYHDGDDREVDVDEDGYTILDEIR